MSDEEEDSPEEGFSASEDEWKPGKETRGGESSDDDDSDFETVPNAGGTAVNKKREAKASSSKQNAVKKRKSSIQSLRTKLYNKYKPPPKTIAVRGASNSPSASSSKALNTASKNAQAPNECSDYDDSSSDSSVDNYLVNPAELDLRSSFFDVGDKAPAAAAAPATPPPIFDCNAGMNLSDSDSEDNNESSEGGKAATREAFDFCNLLEKATNLERVKEAIAQRPDAKADNKPEAAGQRTSKAMDVESLLALGENQNQHQQCSLDTKSGGRQKLRQTKSTRQKRQTKARPAEDAVDTEDSDWEEVADDAGGLNTSSAQSHDVSAPSENLEIHVELPTRQRKERKERDVDAVLKRKLNRDIKERQLLLHKASLLCCFARSYLYNRLLNNTELLQEALKLLPSKNSYPPERGTELKYFQSLVTWYKTAIKLKSDKLYPPRNTKKSSSKVAKRLLMEQLKKREASCKQDMVFIFVILLRGMGLQCRLVVNMQPLPLRPLQSELCVIKLKKPIEEGGTGEKDKVHEGSKEMSKNTTKKHIEKDDQKDAEKKKEEAERRKEATKKSNKTESKKPKTDKTTEVPKKDKKSSTIRKDEAKINKSAEPIREDQEKLTKAERRITRSDKVATKGFESENLKDKSNTKGNKKVSKKSKESKVKPSDCISYEDFTENLKDSAKTQTNKQSADKCDQLEMSGPSLESTLESKTKEIKRNKAKSSAKELRPKAERAHLDEGEKIKSEAKHGTKNPRSKPQASQPQKKHKPCEQRELADTETLMEVTKLPMFSKLKRATSTSSSTETKKPKVFEVGSTPIARRTRLASSEKQAQKILKPVIEIGSPILPKIVVCSKDDTAIPVSTASKPTTSSTEATTSSRVARRSRSTSPKVRISPQFLETKIFREKFSSNEPQKPEQKRPKSKSPTAQQKAKISPELFAKISSPESSSSEPTTKRVLRSRNLKVPQLDGADDVDIVTSEGGEKDRLKERKKPQPKKLKNVRKQKQTDENPEGSDFEVSPPKRPKVAPVLKPDRLRKDRRVLSTDEDEGSNAKADKSIASDIWAEVWSDVEDQWICVDLFKGKLNSVDAIRRSASSNLAYVFAFQNDLSTKDVTARYCAHWTTMVRKWRVDKQWLDVAIAPYLGLRTKRDMCEDLELRRIHEEKPMPTAISDYKNHPLYALERHLLKFEAIYPPDAPTLGFVRGEPVYSRDCVHTLHSREIWLKQARTVKLGEKPYKIVKARPKWDRLTQTVIKDQPLEVFGYWQTQDYEPPTAENGLVPRSAYGNVELFKECMLPKKTVHLRLPGLNRICRKVGIDCAPAVIGFDFHQGACHPTFDGFVVCEEFGDQVAAAWFQDQEDQERKEHEKYEARVYGNWKKLVRGLLIRERLKKKYNF